MRLAQVGTIYRKELREQLRDRRTLITLLLIPTLLFPLMTVGLGTLAGGLVERAEQESLSVMILGSEHAPALARAIRTAPGFELVPPSADYVAQINDKKLRAAVEFSREFEQKLQAGAEVPAIKIYHYAGELRSQFAVRGLQRILDEYRDRLVAERLAERQVGPDLLRTFDTPEENVASAQRVGSEALGRILPYVALGLALLLPTVTAIDLTAGEKERGTLETILASPIGRLELAAGKFLTVFTASAGTAMLSLLSMSLAYVLVSWLGLRAPEEAPMALSALSLLAVLGLILPVAALASAAHLAVALFAKSLKEAQSYLTPLAIALVVPAGLGVLPGLELNNRLALVPVLNVMLASRKVMAGDYLWGPMALILLSSCVYAAAALVAAAAAFRRESVLFRT